MKFTDVALSLGEIVTTVEFRKLDPVVIGYGALESAPCWNFYRHRTKPLQGSKFCYLIIKKPRSSEAVRLTLDITTEVATRHGFLSVAKITEKERAELIQIVCKD